MAVCPECKLHQAVNEWDQSKSKASSEPCRTRLLYPEGNFKRSKTAFLLDILVNDSAAFCRMSLQAQASLTVVTQGYLNGYSHISSLFHAFI